METIAPMPAMREMHNARAHNSWLNHHFKLDLLTLSLDKYIWIGKYTCGRQQCAMLAREAACNGLLTVYFVRVYSEQQDIR